MPLITLAANTVELHEFVRFWSALYQDPREHLYEQSIGAAASVETLQALFTWKNGGPLSAGKQRTVNTNFMPLPAVPQKGDVRELTRFILEPGGPIWRIFYLHCSKPATYPIFDQHVYRAMHWIRHGTRREISARPKDIADSYVHEFLAFHDRLQWQEVSPRDLDKALWTFGKFLATPYGNLVGGESKAVEPPDGDPWVYYDHDNAFYRGPRDSLCVTHVLTSDGWQDYKGRDRLAPRFFGDAVPNPAPQRKK